MLTPKTLEERPLASTPTYPYREPLVLALIVLVSSLVLIFLDSEPLSTNFVFPLLSMAGVSFIWAVVGIRSAVLFARSARRRLWRRSVSRGLLFAASILVCLCFLPYFRGCAYLGGALRFAVNRSYYDHEVALLPADDHPRFRVFEWGGMLFAWRDLIYDESDEVALPPGGQSSAWKENDRNRGEFDCGHWNARRLWAHYYIVDFTC
jgi:hypothetical protein